MQNKFFKQTKFTLTRIKKKLNITKKIANFPDSDSKFLVKVKPINKWVLGIFVVIYVPTLHLLHIFP